MKAMVSRLLRRVYNAPGVASLAVNFYIRAPELVVRLAHAAEYPFQVRREQFEFAFRNAPDSGAYVEFGVRFGRSLVLANAAQRKYGKRHAIYGFDSFEGLPEGEASAYAQGEYSAPLVVARKYLSNAGVQAALVPGWFSETLTAEQAAILGPVAVAHLDCDIYTSTAEALSFLGPLLLPGAVLIFDDWLSFGGSVAHGEMRAFDEWSLSDRCVPIALDGTSRSGAGVFVFTARSCAQ